MESTPVSDEIARCGALQLVCTYLGHNDLRQLRFVSRSWKNVASRDSKFRKSICKTSPGWVERFGNSFDRQNCFQWHGVSFSNKLIKSTPIMRAYWDLQFESLRVVKFSKICGCHYIFPLIKNLPNVTEICFDECFTKLTSSNRRYRYHQITTCMHPNGMEDILGENPQLRRPSILSITLKNQITFPTCIFDLLIARSKGTLQKFSMSDCNSYSITRKRYLPTEEEISNKILKLIQENWRKIHSLTLDNVPSLLKYLRPIAFLQREISFPNMDELILGEVEQAPVLTLGLPEAVILILNRMPVRMKKIQLKFMGQFNTDDMIQAVGKMNGMKSFSFHTGNEITPEQIEMLLKEWPNLEDFNVEAHLETNRQQGQEYSGQLRQFCPKLKSLTFLFNDSALRNLSRMAALRCLRIKRGRYVMSVHLRRIFQSLPQLEEFCLIENGMNDSSYIGCVSIYDQLRELRAAPNVEARDQLATQIAALAEEEGIPRINDLRNLQKLQLFACAFTDITLCYGVRFLKLRELDLTACINISDHSMVALGRNNPLLEKVILVKTQQVTRTGINELIRAKPTLVDVHTTKFILHRRRLNFENESDHPEFKRIVSVANQSETALAVNEVEGEMR